MSPAAPHFASPKRRGLVMGILTAGSAIGQLTFLPPVAALAETVGCRPASLGAGLTRDTFGEYTYAWWGGAAMCVIAAILSIAVTRPRPDARVSSDTTIRVDATE